MMDKLSYFFKQFLPEVKGEWKKVTRPGPKEVRQTTIVVIITSVVFAVYLAVTDFVISEIYRGFFQLLGL